MGANVHEDSNPNQAALVPQSDSFFRMYQVMFCGKICNGVFNLLNCITCRMILVYAVIDIQSDF